MPIEEAAPVIEVMKPILISAEAVLASRNCEAPTSAAIAATAIVRLIDMSVSPCWRRCPPPQRGQSKAGSQKLATGALIGVGKAFASHRVAGGGRPPPAPTERSVRIYRTTLFGSWFTALLVPAASRMGGAVLVSATVSAL